MTDMNKRLEELTQRRDQITAQIQALKAREQAAERKRETRRKILLGAAILAKVQRGEWPESRMLNLLDRELTRAEDRALFGLPEKPTPQSESNGAVAQPDTADI